MFSSESFFAAHHSDENRIVFEIGGADGDAADGGCHFRCVEPLSLFGMDESVTRGMVSMEYQNNQNNFYNHSISMERATSHVEVTRASTKGKQQLASSFLIERKTPPPLVPAVSLPHSFDLCEEVSVVEACERVSHLLGQVSGLQVTFLESEFIWACEMIDGLSPVTFETRLYRHKNKSHHLSGLSGSTTTAAKLMIEGQRMFGDRMTFARIFETLKNEFQECPSTSVMMMELEQDFESLSSCPCVESEMEVSEEVIKHTLLSILSSPEADYRTLLEAVQMTGTILAAAAPSLLSSLDGHLLTALELLSVRNPQFFWMQAYVIEKRRSLSLAFATPNFFLPTEKQNGVGRGAIFVR